MSLLGNICLSWAKVCTYLPIAGTVFVLYEDPSHGEALIICAPKVKLAPKYLVAEAETVTKDFPSEEVKFVCSGSDYVVVTVSLKRQTRWFPLMLVIRLWKEESEGDKSEEEEDQEKENDM